MQKMCIPPLLLFKTWCCNFLTKQEIVTILVYSPGVSKD